MCWVLQERVLMLVRWCLGFCIGPEGMLRYFEVMTKEFLVSMYSCMILEGVTD